MRILFVAPAESIHTARWIAQLQGTGWDLHLFPSIEADELHADLAGVTVHRAAYCAPSKPGLRQSGLRMPSQAGVAAIRRVWRTWWPEYRATQLARLVRRIKPDLVHSMDTQSGGYLTLAASKLHDGGRFPVWVATNWGSDVYLFGRLEAHRDRIRQVLANLDYAFCECRRDAELMRQYGFRGAQLPLVPAGGGFRFEEIEPVRDGSPPSRRGLILVKGYQTWAGRALVAMRALERCAELLSGREVAVFSPSNEVAIAAELFQQRTGVPVRLIPHRTPHRSMLALHGAARVYVGLSISDAIGLSLLEAMAMGAFPVQSCTSCADEWVSDGRTGLLVSPDDVDVVEEAVRRALTDDKLVDAAAIENWEVVTDRLDWHSVRDVVIGAYEGIHAQ
jgi:hypothetical protein